MNTFFKFVTRALLLAAVLASANGHAALTDIANSPLASSGFTSVKPNLFFILDNSGSMRSEYMPDSVSNDDNKHCYRNNAYNGVYYNPGITYALPVDAAGVSYPASSFTAAQDDGFIGTSTTNLSSSFRAGNDSSGQAAYYYNYTGSSPATPVTGTCYSDGSYTKVVVGAGEQQNFANWYTYYRTRMLMMKSAVGLAFKNVDNRFRVGFTTISDTGVSSTSSTFLKIADFDSPQKTNWYNKLYAATGNSSTPLRGALSKAGRMYAGQLLTGANDPMQYSCQQNFTLLSTDGYWNTGSESTSSPKYGPYKIDNTTNVGQQDADEARPMYDGGGAHYTKSTSQIRQSQARISMTTSQLQKRTTQIQRSTSNLQKQISQLQTRTSTLQKSTGMSTGNPLQRRDSTNYGASFGPWYDVSSCTPDTSGRVQHECQGGLEQRDSSNYGSSWTAWYSTSSCTEDTSGRYQTQCQSPEQQRTSSNYGSTWTAWYPVQVGSCTEDHFGSNQRECQTGTWSSWANAASCTSSSTTQCQYSTPTAWVGTSTCTPVSASPSSPYTVATARECQTAVTSSYANVTSCTPTTTPDGSGYTNQCQYTGWSAWSNTSSCTPLAQSPGPGYTVGTATQCQTTDTGWVGASSCTASSSGGQTVTCQGPVVTGPTFVASCTAQSASSGNNWTTTACSTTTIQPATPVASCTPVSPSAGNNYTTTSCSTVTTGPTTVSSCTAASPSASNNWTTTTCSAPVYSGGSSDSLADVAEYYWRTDLRTSALGNCTGALGADVCQNNVPGAGSDVNAQQHMTTFTLGLGADGAVAYSPDYQSGGSADFNAITNGPDNWPDPYANPNSVGQNCNRTQDDCPERIDDLWHAAVDGRGVYYSAKNSATLVTGLSNALAGVTARLGSSAAAATSSLEPVAGDNYLFIASFVTGSWTGDLQAKSIDTTTGNIGATPIWSAQSLVDSTVSASSDTRSIYTYDSTASNGLKPFLWANLSGSEQAYFNNICSPTALLSQCSTLSAADQAAASGANLVNYLRGQRGNAGTLYRARVHVLGDMVNSQPQYVKAPPYSYVDGGYSDYRSAQLNRTPMVYEAGNDGMLHAFAAETGQESWAYIPPMIMGNLYRLAENTYAANHRFFVDGSPVAGDVCPNAPSSACSGSEWKTILVGGLNNGGRGYYALDITDPAAPKALWNFSSADDSDLGYTYGNPIIAKRLDGTWVAVVTSGYNNVSPGDGQGYLYVLNAYTGELLEKIGTGVGSTSTPSGLAKINVWLDDSTDKTAKRFYGGDLSGNLWRFTLDDGTPPASPVSTAGTAFLLAQVGQTNGAGNQPITTKPDVTTVSYGGSKYNVVEFGTGEYLGLTDLSDASQQSVYAIKDDLGATSLGLVRTPGTLVEQTLTSTTGANGQEVRTVTNNPVDWAAKAGWYVDLNPSNVSPGERVNIDVQLNLGLLTVASNVPSNDACNVGGYAYLYYFDFKTGSYPSTVTDQTVGSRDPENALVAGMNFVYIQTPGGLQGVNIICTTDATCHVNIPPPPSPGGGAVKRFSWRELVQ